MSRYARQIILPEIGRAGQDRLAAAHALVVGAGGLGAPVLQYLAGAGIGCLTVVDPDCVERGNLHRQPLYGERFVGAQKTAAAAAALRDLNPETRVHPCPGASTPRTRRRSSPPPISCSTAPTASRRATPCPTPAATPASRWSAPQPSGSAAMSAASAAAPLAARRVPRPPRPRGDLRHRGRPRARRRAARLPAGANGARDPARDRPLALGQLVSFEGAGLRFGGFRFDGAPEPALPRGFLAADAITPADFVADLRGADEAPVPAVPWARRLAVAEFGPDGPIPAPGQRAILACRSGLRAWQAADRLAAVWTGEIKLVALGEPEPDRQREPA